MPLFLSPNLPSSVCLDLCEITEGSYKSFGGADLWFARGWVPPYFLEPGKRSTCRWSNVGPTGSQRSEVVVWHIRSTWLFTRCLTPGSCQCPWTHRDQIWPAACLTSAKHHGVGADATERNSVLVYRHKCLAHAMGGKAPGLPPYPTWLQQPPGDQGTGTCKLMLQGLFLAQSSQNPAHRMICYYLSFWMLIK